MLMRKGVQYTLVILSLLSASAAHAAGEGTGILRDCRLLKVQMYEQSDGVGPARDLVEGMKKPIFFQVVVGCRQPIGASRYILKLVSWAPDGTLRSNEFDGTLRAGTPMRGAHMPILVGQYRFEITAEPRQPAGRTQVQDRREGHISKMAGSITLEADPAPCPRKILPPRVIQYGG